MTLDAQAAQEARRNKIEHAKEHLKLEYADESHWKELARKYSFRLPPYYQPASETKYVKRLFQHVDMDIKQYLDDMGGATLKQLVKMDSGQTALASVGLALEYIDEVKTKC